MEENAKVRHIDWYPDEWLGGTIGLNNDARGLYITACCLIYSAGGPITREHLRAACRDHGHAFNRQYATLIEAGKLIENDGQITNKRSINELQKAQKRTAKAQQNGGKGGRPTKENNEIGKPDGFPEEKTNYQPPTTNQEEKDSLSGVQKAAPRKVVSRRQVPEDWLPSDAGREFACDRAGWSGARIERETEHFRDHHRKRGTPLADIDAGWRTWVMNGAKFDGEKGNGRSMRRANSADNLIEGFGRAVGLGAPDSGLDRSAASPLLDGEYVRFDA